MAKERIYKYLVKAGMSRVGALAMLANIQAESGFKSTNVQDGLSKRSDEAYTMAVDNGTYSDFVKDQLGYGLCQWTYPSRKASLLSFARMVGSSIGDEAMQCGHIVAEMKELYPGLWTYLKSADNLYTAVSRICKEYERPAVNNISTRYDNALALQATLPADMDLSSVPSPTPEPEAAPVPTFALTMRQLGYGVKGKDVEMVQLYLNASGYSCGEPDGVYGQLTAEAVKLYQTAAGLKADGICGPLTWAALLK